MVLEVRSPIVRCDVCGEPDAKPYCIKVDGVSHEIDLDEKHAAPLVRLLAKARVATEPETGRDARDRQQLIGLVRGLPNMS